jgi:serine/threonine protein phosphatase PrpC
MCVLCMLRMQASSSGCSAGCAAVVAVIDCRQSSSSSGSSGGKLHIGHAGDSRAVLCRAGQAVSLTDDHKPLQQVCRLSIAAASTLVIHTLQASVLLSLVVTMIRTNT